MMFPVPDVLVTGSSGHLGCALVYALPSYGYTPIGIDVLANDTTTETGAIQDKDFVRSIFAKHPSIRYVLHTATLHKPHITSHSKSDFITTNVHGTLLLLEEASKLPQLKAFVFTSTTSAFGTALAPSRGEPAAWIDENVVPRPKNIYGSSKIAAEDLCQLVQAENGMPTVVLRTSRFFPEQDDARERREAFGDDNLKVCELAYRRVDIDDVVQAHVCAMRKAEVIGWGKYIISAPTPFSSDEQTLVRLDKDAAQVFREAHPGCAESFAKKHWKFIDRVDRVYDSSKAVRELGWRPTYDFARAVQKVADGEEWRSDLCLRVGKRGYHTESTGVYTIR